MLGLAPGRRGRVPRFVMALAWILAVILGAENPCTNGSFEVLGPYGFPADWGPVGRQVELASDAHTGRHALRFVRRPGTEPRIETGLNRVRLLDRLQGGMEFWYKAISAQDARLRIYVIPVNAQGIERTGSSRAMFTVPEGHIGDGQWHRGRIKYDYSKDPKVRSVHFAVRIEGTAGELLVDDFAYLERVGPVLRFGTVRLEEDPQAPGQRCRVHAPIHNDGDAPAGDVRASLVPISGLAVHPAEVQLETIAPGKLARAFWTLQGRRQQSGVLRLEARTGKETADPTLRLAPKLAVRSFGPSAPVAAAGQPIEVQCELENRGTAIAPPVGVTLTLGGQSKEVHSPPVLPGKTCVLSATFVPPAEKLEEAVSYRVRSAIPCENAPCAKATLVIGNARALPPPLQRLRALVNDQFAVLENEHVRLVFRKNAFGFGPGELLVKSRSGWATAAWMPALGRLALRQDQDSVAMGSLCAAQAIAATEGEEEARLELAAAAPSLGDIARVQVEFRLRRGSRLIVVQHRLEAARPLDMVLFVGPAVYALARDEAIFPGLEWLVGEEVSSSALDIAEEHPDRTRFAPHPNYVTVPAMGVHGPHGTVGLIWDVHQRWDGRHDRPRAVFASPDRFHGQRAHLMALSLPTVPEFFAPNQPLAHKPYRVEPANPLVLRAEILADGQARDALASVEAYLQRVGLPPPSPLPRGSYEKEIEFSMQGYLKSLWVAEEERWWTSKGGGILSHKDRPPAYAADVLVGALLSPDPEVRAQCRALAERVGRLLGAEPRLEALRFPGRFDLAVANPFSAASLLQSQGKDGAWRFDADLQAGPPFVGMDYYELGPDDAVEVGTCARKAYEVLRYARVAGDAEAYRRVLPTLELMERFQVPRAAQVWEVPVHTPDILAAADAADAFIEAYRFSGDRRWLADAITWARRGLPFVYLWQDSEKPFLLGASIPVFGATWYQGSWFGRPVQWNGLRYAEALLKLADYDHSLPWRHVAELLIRSAIHQQDASGENVALWPDNISAVDGTKCPWVFAPRMIVQGILHLLGRDEEPATAIAGEAPRRVHLTATVPLGKVSWDGRTCAFQAAVPAGQDGLLLVSNVSRPARVSVAPVQGSGAGPEQNLPERDMPEKGSQPGWRYDSAWGFLVVRLPGQGTWHVRIEGAAFRHVDRLPQPAESIAFEFSESAEGWLAAHDIGELEVRGGSLAGSITGADPYLVRSLLNVSANDCPVIVLRMRVTAGQTGQLYWGTRQAPGFSEQRVVVFPLQADGQFHEYRLPVGEHPQWKGQTITELRIDPGNGARQAEFAIDYVRGVAR